MPAETPLITAGMSEVTCVAEFGTTAYIGGWKRYALLRRSATGITFRVLFGLDELIVVLRPTATSSARNSSTSPQYASRNGKRPRRD